MTQPPYGQDPNLNKPQNQQYPPPSDPYGQSNQGGYPTQQPPQPQYGAPQGYGDPQGYGAPQQQYGAPQGYGQMSPTGPGGSVSKRPGKVTAAAVLAFVVGGLGLIANLAAFSLVSSLGLPGIYTPLLILSMILAAAMIWGGVVALSGKDSRILVATAGGAILINIISMFVYFSPSSLISFVIPILIIAFLMAAESKAWFKSKGGATF